MSTKRGPSIAVLSNRGLFRESIVYLLNQHGFHHTIGHANFRRLVRATRGEMLDLILVDLDHQEDDVHELLGKLRVDRPQTTVVAIGTPLQLAAQASSASGWIEERPTASADRVSAVASAVARAHHRRVRFPMPPEVERQGQVWQSLTARERQVLGLVGCGIDNGEIGTALGISARAVKAHVTRLFKKFSIDRRARLALIACRAGLHGSPTATPPIERIASRG